MAFLKVANRAISSLASGISDSDLSLTVATGEGALFPATGDFHLSLDTDALREIVKCTARSTDVLTVVRAQEGTSAAAHDADKAVQLRITAGIVENLQTEIYSHSQDVNYNKYKAIALVCDKGATMPADPTDGQWFLHTPTGRNVLYQYNSEWIPIISVGTMTLYVDKTDGTDDLNHGTGVDSDAFATVQYAVDCIPGLVGGNVIIYINDEAYTESVTIQGKALSGDYSISIYGTLSLQETAASATVAAGTGATQGTVTKAGQFTGDTYANMLAYFVTNGTYRLIDSHTNDVLTLVGTAPSSTTQDVGIYGWGTSINKIDLAVGQAGVVLYDIELDTVVGIICRPSSQCSAYRCNITGGVYSTGGITTLTTCYVTAASPIRISTYGYVSLQYSKVYLSGAGTGCQLFDFGYLALGNGSIIDAVTTTATIGIDLIGLTEANCYTSAGGSWDRIRNLGIGIHATLGGKGIYTSRIQYSGNTADETADAASFGYID